MVMLPAGTENSISIDGVRGVRTIDLPFALPNQLYRVTETDIVTDVLHALQGNGGEKIHWDNAKQDFALKDGTHVSHLSQCSLVSLLQPFLSASTCLRRVEKFVAKATRSAHERGYPTLEAFANVAAMRLKHLRDAALKMELATVADGSITLLNLFTNLSWVCAGAEFLDHVVTNGVPQLYVNYDAANLSSRILSFLYESLNEYCLLKDGEDEAYRTLLMFFVGTLWPYIQLLDSWLQEGSLADPCGEMFFYANSAITIQDSAFWQSGYYARYVTRGSVQTLACPSFLEALAKPILSTGKSLQLLQHVQRESGRGFLKTTDAKASLFHQLCNSLKKLLVQPDAPSDRPLGDIQASEPESCSGKSCIFASPMLGSLDDSDLRRKLYSEADASADSKGDPAECTNYVLGDGCGRILRSQMLVDRTALSKFLVYPTFMPLLKETGLIDALPYDKTNMEATEMLQWLQEADLTATPSSTIIVQDCLISYIEKQVSVVGSKLLGKLMGEWHLLEEMALLRAIYLMGSGDLLQQFSFVLFNKLDRGEPWDDFYELNTMLQESLRSSADGTMYSKLDSLVLTMDPRASTPQSPVAQYMGRSPIQRIDVLENIRFEYKVAWPLELIIDSAALKKYNQIMCFLLKLKRAKQALDKACRWMWKGDSGFHKQQLLLQMKLMHFVNTLHHYVMDQVFYSSWLDLCQGIASARSLDEVISCHEMYLVSIQRQCFVAPDKLWTLVSSRVKTILGLALDFYSVQRALFGGRFGGGTAAGMNSKCQQEMEGLAKQFDECVAFLLRVLSFKLNVGHFPHLTDLITRINYNNFYISESGQLLAPIPGDASQRRIS